MNFQDAIDAYVIGMVGSEDLPKIAQNAIHEGYASPALFDLAVSGISDYEDNKRMFIKTVTELGIELPTQETAALSCAKRIARLVVKQELDPYSGAKQIWHSIYAKFPHLDRLRLFVGAASEYEDDPAHRSEYSQLIVDECNHLLFSSDG